MSTQEQPHDPAPAPISDPPLAHEQTAAYPPPETPEPTKTASERAPQPGGAPVETDGHDMPVADAEMVTNASNDNGTESATGAP